MIAAMLLAVIKAFVERRLFRLNLGVMFWGFYYFEVCVLWLQTLRSSGMTFIMSRGFSSHPLQVDLSDKKFC